jgi:hypothetical protein
LFYNLAFPWEWLPYCCLKVIKAEDSGEARETGGYLYVPGEGGKAQGSHDWGQLETILREEGDRQVWTGMPFDLYILCDLLSCGQKGRGPRPLFLFSCLWAGRTSSSQAGVHQLLIEKELAFLLHCKVNSDCPSFSR